MTEQEWLACTDPTSMLEYLRGKASNRKLRLFAVACCRRIYHLLSDPRSQRAVDAGEQFAEGMITQERLDSIAYEANVAADEPATDEIYIGDANHAAFAAATPSRYEDPAHYAAAQSSWGASRALAVSKALQLDESGFHRLWPSLAQQEKCVQAELLRDLLGPFGVGPVAIDPSWLAWNDGTIPRLAQAIYDDRRFADLPILADALEDAGCINQEILGHCRGLGPHVRGCWVVDLLLGKE